MPENQRNNGFNPEHLEIYGKGVNVWNEWRKNNPQAKVSFQGNQISGYRQLEGYNLSYVNLSNVRFNSPILSDADLTGANLSGAWLENANLSGVNFTGADLSGANLQGANVSGANLSEAILFDTNLTEADLQNCIGLKLDNTIIRNARFSPNAHDLWSVLRRTYTGHRLIINLLFFMAFISPYIAKILFWVGINNMQEANAILLANTQTDTMLEGLNNFALCLSSVCDESRVWELVIGLDKNPLFWVLTSLLIFYNLCKIGLTWLVSPLRDEEERSGHSPQLKPSFEDAVSNGMKKKSMPWRLYLQTYGWMVYPHRFVSILFWLAILTFIVHGYDWLSSPVFISANS